MGVRDVITGRLLVAASPRFTDEQVVETLHLLIAQGVRRGANTIHIEPHNQYVLVRYRIDGVLRGAHKLPRAASAVLMATLKQLADLAPHDTYTPQDGQFVAEASGHQPVHVRVSVMPVLGGEKAVLHLLPEQNSPAGLATLGFWGENLQTIQELLARPQGLITVAGPRHSGKTTTLYSMLQLVHKPGHSVATLEEHRTIRLTGASQSYLHNHGSHAMASGLQALLRQDPNVILLGSIPDGETAEQTLSAATSGHLLLAELPADDAVTGTLRLRSLVHSPFMLATGLKAAVGQRLVRTLCPHCRQRFELTDELRKKLETAFGIATPADRTRVFELELAAQRAGLGDAELASSKHSVTRVWRARKGGCEQCGHSGYKGRTVISEILEINETIQKMLLASELPTPLQLRRAALKAGFTPMGLDGLVKILRGQTTVAEVLRAVTPS
ncbi:MAG: GspE/PulE family protein [Candidatus Saccharimonadales bacterium]